MSEFSLSSLSFVSSYMYVYDSNNIVFYVCEYNNIIVCLVWKIF
jgi:hypothetical protein